MTEYRWELDTLQTALRESGGYHDEVLWDEAHAHSIETRSEWNPLVPTGLREGLTRNFEVHTKRLGIVLPTREDLLELRNQ